MQRRFAAAAAAAAAAPAGAQIDAYTNGGVQRDPSRVTFSGDVCAVRYAFRSHACTDARMRVRVLIRERFESPARTPHSRRSGCRAPIERFRIRSSVCVKSAVRIVCRERLVAEG
jgi:hypothetical protein